MSTKILSSVDIYRRTRRFFDIVRTHLPEDIIGKRSSRVFGVAAMILSHERAGKFALDLKADSNGFCKAEVCGEELKVVFDALRERFTEDALVQFINQLARVSIDLSKPQVKFLSKLILEVGDSYGYAGIGKRHEIGNFLASREMAQLMLKLTEIEGSPNADVFVPCVPYAGIAGLAENTRVVCSVPNSNDAAIMAVHQLVYGGNADVETLMPEREPELFTRHQKIDRIIAGPFGYHGRHSREHFCVEQIAQNLRGDHGKAAICVSSHLLCSEAVETSRLRRDLIQSGLVEAIIQLPRIGTAHAILLLKSGDKGGGIVRVIDASGCETRKEGRSVLDVDKVLSRVRSTVDGEKTLTITDNLLVESEYDLTPALYLASNGISVPLPDGHTLVSLDAILSPIHAKKAQPRDQAVVVDQDILSNTPGFESSFEERPMIHASELKRSNIYRIITGSCLLVDRKSFRFGKESQIRTCWFSHRGKDLFVEPSILPMKVNLEKADPIWVAVAFKSRDFSRQVECLLTGYKFDRKALMKVRVALPNTLEQQKAIGRSAEELQIGAKVRELGFETLLKQQQEGFLRDMRLKKHTLSQIARDIRSRITVVNKALNEHGKLEAEQSIGLQGTALHNYLDHIETRCDDMGRTLESLTKSHTFSDLEELSLKSAFNSLKTACKGRHFKLTTHIDEDSFKNLETGADLKPTIHLAEKDFSVACENIFDNAERHGFQDRQVDYEIYIEAFLDHREQMVILSFKNNGKPLPEGLTLDRFVTRGEQGGSSGNTGIGGHHIKSLMDHAKGKIDIRNLTEDFFQVEVTLSFPFQP